jgi:hypothetical protein
MLRFLSKIALGTAGLSAIFGVFTPSLSWAADGGVAPAAGDPSSAPTASEGVAAEPEPAPTPVESSGPAVASPPAAAPPAAAVNPAPRGPVKPTAKPAAGGRVDIAGGLERSGAQRDAYDGPPLLIGGKKKVKVGGYFGMGGGYTRFLGDDSGLVSLEGAMLFDHRLSLGAVGYAFTRTPAGPRAYDGEPRELAAGYGGAALRYSLLCRSPVYATFGLVLGAGAVNLHRDNDWDDEDDWDDGWNGDDEWDRGKLDMFLVAQPEFSLNSNITRWLRLGAMVGYRFTGGINRFGLAESDVNGIVAGGNIQFGWF